MWKLLIPALAILILLGVVVASDSAQRSVDFTYLNRGDISTLDLHKMSWMQDLRVARTLFEGLVRHDIFSAGYDLLPGVAEKWEVSPDGLVYTFHLRDNAKWSNGAPVTAGDFVYSWRRAILPDTGCDYSRQFQAIKGARAFYEWRQEALASFRPGVDDAAKLWDETEKRFTQTVAIHAPDDRTFVFELERPVPYFLDLCAFAVFYPVYPPLIAEFERPDPATGRLENRSGWTKAGVLVSNGAYTLTQWRFKRDMRMERNPYYWRKTEVALDSILLPSIDDPNAQVLAFDSSMSARGSQAPALGGGSGVDLVTDVTPDYRADMVEAKARFYREHQAEYDALVSEGLDQIQIDRRLPPDPRSRIHVFPAFGTYFYNFNCQPKLPDGRDNPFHDPRVRRAFAMAIDKDRIVTQIRRVGEKVATTIIPPGSILGYHSPRGVPFDPAGARALLAEAGYPGGKGFVTVQILFNSDGGHGAMAQTIKKDWETNLGVSVALEQKEIKVFRNDLKNGNYMVSRAGWYGDYGDPTTFLNTSRRDDGNNDRKYYSSDFEDLMNRADRETDPDKRMRLLEQAESILVDRDCPMAPVYQYVNIYLFDAHRIDGISSHPRQEQDPYLFRRLDRETHAVEAR